MEPVRLRYPEDEHRLEWLARLLDAYAVIDAGVVEALDKAAGVGLSPACGKGCAACCAQPIPVTPLEILGICWFVGEKLAVRTRQVVKRQLMAINKNARTACPFLIGSVCAVHPLRPAVCRNYIVFGRACAPGEDVCATRPLDVMRPSSKAMREAFRVMLPYYGIKGAEALERALDEKLLYKKAVTLQGFDWSEALRDIAARDRKNR
jgi:uncharacterized protein